LGILGIFLPLLHTTRLILLAAACYARSSPRFYNWPRNHHWFGPPLRRWRTTGSIPRRSKVLAISLIVLTIGWAILFLKLALVVRTILAVIGISVSIYLLRIPTRH